MDLVLTRRAPPAMGGALLCLLLTACGGGAGDASVNAPERSVDSKSDANRAPQIFGMPPLSVAAAMPYSFTLAATDPDSDRLSFSISNLPAWAAFDSTTGTLSGTPGGGDEGFWPGIRISVTDGADTTTMAAFSITVIGQPNTAPMIGGSPRREVSVNEAYSFKPTVSDADGDRLSFSASGLPGWANFDSSTGQLYGTPGAGDAGVYGNIVIRVSDGQAQASLPAFGITVASASAANGFAKLFWTVPTENDDGTALRDLAGFRIYFGVASGTYTQSRQIANPGVSMYFVGALSVGTWYFVVTAYDTSGNESVVSNVASKTIAPP